MMRFTATCLQCVSVIHTDPDSSLSSITLYGCNVCDWHGYAYKVVVVVFPLYLFCSPLMLRFATDSVNSAMGMGAERTLHDDKYGYLFDYCINKAPYCCF